VPEADDDAPAKNLPGRKFFTTTLLFSGSVRRSMKPTARLIVIESVIPEGPAFNLGKWTDLQMLVCVGGRERTE